MSNNTGPATLKQMIKNLMFFDQKVLFTKYPFLKNKYFIAVLIIVSVFLLMLLFFGGSNSAGSIPTYTVKRNNFLVTISESGEIKAQNSISISAPRVRGTLKIVYLVPEGTYIKPGELVAKFDPTEAMTRLRETQADLEIAESNKEKLIANQKSDMAKMDSDLKSAELSYELSKLNLEQMKFEAEAKRREAQLQHQKNELSFLQTKQSFESRKIIQQTEMNNMNVEIRQKKNELDKAQRDVDALTLTADAEGLVVYEINWNNQGRRFQVGDQPWPGQTIVTLPDLSGMQSQTSVNEVDISKVSNGLKVIVKLDAFQDSTFIGKVSNVAKLGKQTEGNSNIKVFDVYVSIDGTSEILKPGMTTNNKIIINEIPDTIFIPQEAVFQRDDKFVAYKLNGSGWDETKIEVGEKSEDFIIVKKGLTAGDVVALRNPNNELNSSPETMEKEGVQIPVSGN